MTGQLKATVALGDSGEASTDGHTDDHSQRQSCLSRGINLDR